MQTTRSQFYAVEGGGVTSSAMTSSRWVGAIGLMYPSDYGYATSSTNDICNTATIRSWDSGLVLFK